MSRTNHPARGSLGLRPEPASRAAEIPPPLAAPTNGTELHRASPRRQTVDYDAGAFYFPAAPSRPAAKLAPPSSSSTAAPAESGGRRRLSGRGARLMNSAKDWP